MQNTDELPFEAKFNMFKDEIQSYGVPFNNLINLSKLLDVLDMKITDKAGKDLIIAIHNFMDKDNNQNFTLNQFFDACTKFRRNLNEKVETTQIQLSKLQAERSDAGAALAKKQEREQDNMSGDKRTGTLNIEINGLQYLNISPHKSVFVRLSCYNIRFNTSVKQYVEQLAWKEKFTFDIQTGFERVDISVLTTSHMYEEVIGTAQIHVSGIKDQSYSNEWTNLYDGQTYIPQGSVKLGLQLVPSKIECRYLQKITEKLDGNIASQIAEIEGLEKSLKTFNVLLLGQPRNSCTQSPTNRKKNRTSPQTKKGPLTCRTSASGERGFRTILEEEDGESCESSQSDILPALGNHYNFNSTPVSQRCNTEEPRLSIETSPILTRMSEKGTKQNERVGVYAQENEIMAKNPFAKLLRPEPIQYNNTLKDLGTTNSSLDTQSQSHSSNPMSAELSDKDAIINYLQKKLNEVTRDNEQLSTFVAELTMENDRLKLENTKIDEYKSQAQDYEEKICMLFGEIKRLDKIASQNHQEGSMPKNPKVLENILNQVKPNMKSHEQNIVMLLEENQKLTQLLSKQAQEVNYWKLQTNSLNNSYSGQAPSPRLVTPVKNSLSKTQPGIMLAQIIENEQKQPSRRMREPVKIFPSDKSLDSNRNAIFNTAYY